MDFKPPFEQIMFKAQDIPPRISFENNYEMITESQI